MQRQLPHDPLRRHVHPVDILPVSSVANPTCPHGKTWERNPFNDDIMWMVIACTRGHLLTGNPEFRAVAKSNFDLCYEVVDHEPLIVLMPSDHRLISREAIHPREFVGEIFIGGSNKATVLRAVTEDYLRRCGLDIKLDHGVDNLAMAMSLVASTRGLALMPAYAKDLLPWSVVSRPLEGEAPTIDLAVGYSKANTSPILKLFLSRLEELRTPMAEKRI